MPISHADTVVLVGAAVFTAVLFVVIALIPDRRTEDEKRRDERRAIERQRREDETLAPKVDPNEPARWVP